MEAADKIMEIQPSARQRRLHSYPGSSGGDDFESEDYATANEAFPVRVPLERVELGSWKYTATELEDIELLYELESSDLLIKTSVRGTTAGAVPATFRVKDVSAADLSLVNIVPGSPESMVARLILETESDVSYNHDPLSIFEKQISGKDTKGEGHEDQEKQQNDIECRRITMTASVHESGHLRDILLFLKCGCVEDFSPDDLFLSPKRGRSKVEPLDGSPSRHQVTFLEGLPFWVLYIPWRLYSKKTRVVIQKAILLYSLFSVMWASWQLYRHVNVIHVALEPIIKILKLRLSLIMDTFDAFLALFTVWWTTFLSPLNVFCGMLLTPVLQLVLQLRGSLAPLWGLIINSGFIGVLKALYQLFQMMGSTLWVVLTTLGRPFYSVGKWIMNSQIAVASLDFNRIRLSWVVSLVTNSVKAIGNGLAKLAGYTRTKQKQIKARQNPPSVTPSPSPRVRYRQRRMPVYYSSPLTKQN